jgi:hypothetical protein
MKRYRVSRFHTEQAQGHERQSIDWNETLLEARLLAMAYSEFYACSVVVDDTQPNDDGFTHLVAEYQNGVQVGNHESLAQKESSNCAKLLWNA